MFSKSTLAGVTITTYTSYVCSYACLHVMYTPTSIIGSLGVLPESAGIVTSSYENIDLTIFGRLQVIIWL